MGNHGQKLWKVVGILVTSKGRIEVFDWVWAESRIEATSAIYQKSLAKGEIVVENRLIVNEDNG